MSNMSYCRFENTDNALADCQGALEELTTGAEPLSRTELAAAKSLAARCVSILEILAETVNVPVEELFEQRGEEHIAQALDELNTTGTEEDE